MSENKKETPVKEEPRNVRMFAIDEDTYNELMQFVDMVPYGQVKGLVSGLNSGAWLNLEVVPEIAEDESDKEAA